MIYREVITHNNAVAMPYTTEQVQVPHTPELEHNSQHHPADCLLMMLVHLLPPPQEQTTQTNECKMGIGYVLQNV
jgi:hypothetical protein